MASCGLLNIQTKIRNTDQGHKVLQAWVYYMEHTERLNKSEWRLWNLESELLVWNTRLWHTQIPNALLYGLSQKIIFLIISKFSNQKKSKYLWEKHDKSFERLREQLIRSHRFGEANLLTLILATATQMRILILALKWSEHGQVLLNK